MREFPPVALAAIFGLLLLGQVVFHFNVRRKIRQKLAQTGVKVGRIRPFDGFLDLGSIKGALTITGRYASVLKEGGQKSEVLCLVHYIPLVGIVRTVGIWEYESDAAGSSLRNGSAT